MKKLIRLLQARKGKPISLMLSILVAIYSLI